MRTKPDSFKAVLDLWETPKALSDDLGVPYVTAQLMIRRKSVGIDHWPKLVELVRAKGHVITNDDLVAMSLKQRAATRKAKRQSEAA